MGKKSPPENPVTPEHAALFDGLFKRWLEQLNLSDWRVVKLKKPSTNMAEITEQDTNNRIIRYKVGSDFGQHEVSLDSLEDTAIHEALHCRFHEMLEAAYEDGEYSERVIGAEHATIVVLTPLLHELARLKRLVAAAESDHGGSK
jgi:hypothetical protein